MTLFLVEVRRGLARRATRVLIGLAVAFIVLAGVIVFLSSRPGDANTPANRADAARARQAYIDDCVATNGFGGELSLPPGQDVRTVCEQNTGPVSDYLHDKEFRLTSLWETNGEDGALGGTAIFLVIGALIAGATFIGGDWRFGTIGTQLTWEPRRTRVFLAKVAAVASVSLVVGVLLQALVTIALLPAARWRGTTEGADSEWFVSLVGITLRSGLLGAGAALIGFAIANIGRNTAAALGVAFGYVAVAESVVRGWKPEWQPWLIGDNSTVVLFGRQIGEASFERTFFEAIAISGAYLVLLLAASGLVFRRRDVAA